LFRTLSVKGIGQGVLMKKIYIAGHGGLVGSALERLALKKGYRDIIKRSHQELELLDQEKVFKFFSEEKPEWVFLAAARVGGIYANNTYPVDFLLDNLKIQNNIIEAAYKFNVEKLLFLGSSCIYPKNTGQPIKEEALLTSPLEPTNEAYAIAKIAGIKLCNAFNKQYHTDFLCVMPSNLYGPNDNYHPENAHALPMLLRRFHEAKVAKLKEVAVWGSGTPKREFLYVDDLADACFFLMENYDSKAIGELINIGTGKDLTILELAHKIKEVVGYRGDIVLDRSKPDGTMRKVVDVAKINKLGWSAGTDLDTGLKKTYEDYLNQDNRK
jgi:GDP-L-fucose synthase